MMRKKAQQEIIGFVLIIVVVAIVGLIFLSLTVLRSETRQESSVELSNLLQAANYYTTDCAISQIPDYEDIEGLTQEYYRNKDRACLNGKTIEQTLEPTLKKIISNSLNVHEDSPNKAYMLNISYFSEETYEDILTINEGVFKNCSSIIGADHNIHIITFVSGTIEMRLEVCKG